MGGGLVDVRGWFRESCDEDDSVLTALSGGYNVNSIGSQPSLGATHSLTLVSWSNFQ